MLFRVVLYNSDLIHRLIRSEVLNSVVSILFLPEGEVLLEQLNDRLSISESLLIDIVDFLKGLGEGNLAKLTGLLVVVHNLIVEHGEVKGKSESNGVACVELLGELLGLEVSLEGSLLDFLESGFTGGLGNISVVVTDHLLEECL